MATLFEVVYSKFINRITDINLALKFSTSINLAESETYDYLDSACASFTKCKQDLTDRDIVLKQFNFTVTALEIEIIVKYMIVAWTEKFISSITSLEDSLGSNDFKIVTGFTGLSPKIAYQTNVKKSIGDDIIDYGYDLKKDFDSLC